MAKNLKLNIKNTQIAEAINLSGLKGKLAKKKTEEKAEKSDDAFTEKNLPSSEAVLGKVEGDESDKGEVAAPRIRARSKSVFAEPIYQTQSTISDDGEPLKEEVRSETPKEELSFKEEKGLVSSEEPRKKTSAEIRKKIFGDDALVPDNKSKQPPSPQVVKQDSLQEEKTVISAVSPVVTPEVTPEVTQEITQPIERLGPTGRHVNDLIRKKVSPKPAETSSPSGSKTIATSRSGDKAKSAQNPPAPSTNNSVSADDKKGGKPQKFKEFRDIKPPKRSEAKRFDGRDKQGLRGGEDEQGWRKRRQKGQRYVQEDVTVRPSSLKIRAPISIKDLASEMKLKASQLISKLFLQGLVVTLNDLLDDDTTIQLLGQEFDCEITIDTSEEERIRITDQSIKEELMQSAPENLTTRSPVVAFMGHVDHGKTSLIDAIRKTQIAAGEAGAITQHIGAFRCSTAVGDITILDTPGHEAFSAMRARGADVTDIVVLVIAGDEGLRQQSIEAIQHAKTANVTIVVAINKSDKPNFDPDTVYRQLADNNLLPEAWGGTTITINCSAVTKDGIKELLEMLAIQAEVLELKADPTKRARGTVLESEMHKGLGSVATVLVQNGTLNLGNAIVFGSHWGRIKTMKDDHGKNLKEAGPSTPVSITGLSGLPDAGEEFIVVKSEREAREIAEARMVGSRQSALLMQQKKKVSIENLVQQASEGGVIKKTLNIVLRADVQGSLEALKTSLLKIHSDLADLDIIFAGVGEVSESDVQLAATSKAVILGFHTQVESHAEPLVKQLGVQVCLHDIIYHAVDDIKSIMSGILDKIAIETEKGKATVRAVFKSSQTGLIAGCIVTEGSIFRNSQIRLKRGNVVIWTGSIASLKRVKEDVREVHKGLECGILLNNFSDIQEDDVIEAYEVSYIAQEL